MTFKETTGHLIKAGLVKTCPVDVQAITKLIRRAYLDLRTAKRNLERKKRHQFIYEPDIPCSMTEVSEGLKTARAFVDQVAVLIRAKRPQREFHFGKESS